MLSLPRYLAASFILITAGWFTDLAVLGIVGCLLVVPLALFMLGAFVWQVIQ